MRNFWYVIETPCYPKSFKVQNDYYRPDNDSRHYFTSRELAQIEADKRNSDKKQMNCDSNT